MERTGPDRGAPRTPGPGDREKIFVIGLGLGSVLLGAGFLLGRASAPAPAPWEASDRRASPPPRETSPLRPVAERAVPHERNASSPPAEPDPTGTMMVMDHEASVLGFAAHGSPIVGTVDRDATVRVLEVRGEFRRITRPGQSDVPFGWIYWRSRAPAPVAPSRPLRGVYGTATVRGVVRFTGRAPEMKVPKKRKDAEFCKATQVPYNAVVVSDGKLRDVLVRLSNASVKGDYEPPDAHAQIFQSECMYVPRIQGVVAGQTIDIRNADQTLHNVHTYKGAETWFNRAQVKGTEPITKEMPDDPALVKFACDVHPWMRAFVVVNAHPFFSVTGPDGVFSVERVPDGDYTLEAWHPRYGVKIAKVNVVEGTTVEAAFAYDGTEPEPAENKDELKDLF
jgi:plastocyanin